MRKSAFLLSVFWIVTAALVGTSGLAAPKKQIKPGVERWPIKTSVVANADQKTVALADLLKLPDPPGVAKDDHRYQSNRIPSFQNPLGLKEGDQITTSGWLHLVAGENDGDYHIQLSASKTSGDNCIVIEVPRGEPAFVTDASLRTTVAQVRQTIRKEFLRGKEPSSTGSVLKQPVYVQVTGQLFYDDAHVGDPPRGKKGMHAATLWELHPVAAIARAAPPSR